MTDTDRMPSDVVEARLNHLIDRARRGALLPEEADRFTTELRNLVRRLEDEEDERAHDNVALHAIARQRDEADARITELDKQREQAEDLLRVAHETSNRSEAERARAAAERDQHAATIARVRAWADTDLSYPDRPVLLWVIDHPAQPAEDQQSEGAA